MGLGDLKQVQRVETRPIALNDVAFVIEKLKIAAPIRLPVVDSHIQDVGNPPTFIHLQVAMQPQKIVLPKQRCMPICFDQALDPGDLANELQEFLGV